MAHPSRSVLAMLQATVVCASLACFLTSCSSAPCSARVDTEDVVVESGGVKFIRKVIDNEACGAAHVATGDMDGDGVLDLVLTTYGERTSFPLSLPNGTLSIYRSKGGSFERRDIITPQDGLRFLNRPTLSDVDLDGDRDIILPLGFFVCSFLRPPSHCGGLMWLENQGDLAFTRHQIVPYGSADFFHGVVHVDFDGDGMKDLVTVAEQRNFPWDEGRSQARWFKGTDKGIRFDREPDVIGDGMGSFPAVADADGDHDLDVLSAEFFGTTDSFAWLEREGANINVLRFSRHVISGNLGLSMELRPVPNLRGDGRLMLVGSNHSNHRYKQEDPSSALVLFKPGADPRQPWEQEVLSDDFNPVNRSGQFAPGALDVGDINGDGRMDILLSGDGDSRLFWFAQQADGSFIRHVLETDWPQAGSPRVVDVDGDGRADLLFPVYQQNALVLYRQVPP